MEIGQLVEIIYWLNNLDHHIYSELFDWTFKILIVHLLKKKKKKVLNITQTSRVGKNYFYKLKRFAVNNKTHPSRTPL